MENGNPKESWNSYANVRQSRFPVCYVGYSTPKTTKVVSGRKS